jgi:two-component system, cell cycle sensor histidine kinase and response regulator CckA
MAEKSSEGSKRERDESRGRLRELEESRRRYRELFESSRDGIVFVDARGRIIDANPAYCAMLGYSLEELRGKVDFYDITPRRWHQWEREEIWNRRLLQDGYSGVYEKEYIREDGAVFPVELQSYAVLDEAGEPRYLWGIARDITERKQSQRRHEQLEEQLRHSQRMEAVGRLAGGVAHDFNNLLTAILSYSELLELELPEGGSSKQALSQVRRAGERAASLTGQLLAFSRRQQLEPRLIDLDEVVRKMDSMLRRLIGEDVEMVSSPADDLWRVLADPGRIEQVIVNLVVNARDAMPGGGRLEIETSNVELDEEEAAGIEGVSAGAYALLAVSDDGCGMDEQTCARVFEPFFTTKEPNKGTGLGLSTVYGIVGQSGGGVRCASEPGRGATFEVYLPRASGEPKSDSAPLRVGESAPQERSLEGNETVLVVEDETAVRELALRVLERYGYRVLAAADADEALRLSEKHEGRIDLLLTDLVMPGGSGPELAESLLERRAEVGVLYMTGHTRESIAHRGMRIGDGRLLRKPFGPVDLAREVRRALNES